MVVMDRVFTLAATAVGGFCERENAYLAHEDTFHTKYRHWRGRSGRAYAFSVYAPADCPAYADAVLLVASRRGGALACLDLGEFPEGMLARLRRRYEGLDVEFHIHVLAERAGDRRALIEDVGP